AKGKTCLADGETLQRRCAAGAAVLDGIAYSLQHVFARSGFDSKAKHARSGADERELHAEKGNPAHHNLAAKERRGSEPDFRLRRLRDDAALPVEHARAQNDEVDARFASRPGERRAIEAHVET